MDKQWPCAECEYNTGLMLGCRGQEYCDKVKQYKAKKESK